MPRRGRGITRFALVGDDTRLFAIEKLTHHEPEPSGGGRWCGTPLRLTDVLLTQPRRRGHGIVCIDRL